MKVTLCDDSFKKIDAEVEIYLVNSIDEVDSLDKQTLEDLKFGAKDEELQFLVESKKIYVGFEDNDYDSIAIAIATAVKKLKTTKYKKAKIELKNDDEAILKALVEGSILGAYSFEKYKSKKKKEKKELFISCENAQKLQKIVDDSTAVANSVNKVRTFVNTIPNDFYPEVMAKEAKKIAKDNENVTCKIHSEEYLERHEMNAMLSVARASVHEPKLIHLTYKPKNATRKIVLVGKGLTYDSGGLSLKPADAMVTMKLDKSGGCAVLGIINAVAKLNLPIEVHGVVGAVENMIGGDAYKPDDVLVAKNGKTIEVRNTDAEGRLVLADCLCYAQDKINDIDFIFDYATLTGACVVGVGQYTTGIMGNNTVLKRDAVCSALNSGEYATTLPFNRFLRKSIKSEVADVCNIANTRYGGAITAGLFLDHFVYEENKDKWLHFDIAGPAYVEKPWGYNPYGGSGAGVRMTIEFMKNLM